MNEQWKPIEGYEDSYEISDLGRVRSIARIATNGRRFEGIILSPGLSAGGRYTVSLCQGSRQKTIPVHRLVALAFVPGYISGFEVCHNSGDALDNRAVNLRWDSRASNQRDAVRHGTHGETRKTACPRLHPYDSANTVIDSAGARRCRACRIEQRRSSQVRRSANV